MEQCVALVAIDRSDATKCSAFLLGLSMLGGLSTPSETSPSRMLSSSEDSFVPFSSACFSIIDSGQP